MDGVIDDNSQLKEADRELAATLLVLEAPIVWQKARPNINVSRRSIDLDEILKTCVSSSEDLLVRSAMALWNGSRGCDLAALQRHLDDDNVTRVLAAILVSRNLIDVDEARQMVARGTVDVPSPTTRA